MKSQDQIVDMIQKQGKFYADILSISEQEQERINGKILSLVKKTKVVDLNDVMSIINEQYSLVAKEKINDNSFQFIIKYLEGTKGKKIINTLDEILSTFKIDMSFDMAVFLLNNYPELNNYLAKVKDNSDYESSDTLAILYDVYCDQNGIDNEFESKEIESTNEKYSNSYYSDDSFAMYLHEIARYPLLSNEEEKELFRRYKEEHDEDARKKIANCNLRLVVSIVSKRYASRLGNNSFTLIDLVQEGNIGLMKAIEKFDYKQGYKFSTYATWWIKQNISRALMDKADTVRLPVHASELSKKLKSYIDECDTQPSIKEIADKFGVSEKLARELLFFTNYVSNLASLNTPIGEGEDSSLEDFVENDEQSIEESVELKILRENIGDLLKQLDPRERDIITKRFGIGYKEPYTLEMIAKELGITRERVRQIQKKAIDKLQDIAKAKTFQGYQTGEFEDIIKTRKAEKYLPNEIKLLKGMKNVSSPRYPLVWGGLSSKDREIITQKYGKDFSTNKQLDTETEKYFFNVVLTKISNLYNRDKQNAFTYDGIFANKYHPKSVINYYRLNDNQKDILAKCYGPYLTGYINPDIDPEDEKRLYPIIKKLTIGCQKIEGYDEYQKLINGEYESIPVNYINLLVNLFKNKDISVLASDKPNEEVAKAFNFILSVVLNEDEYLIVSSYFGVGEERLSFAELSIKIGVNEYEIQKKFLEGARKLLASPHLNLIRKRLWEQSRSMMINEDGFDFYSFFPQDSIKLIPKALTKLDFADIAIIRKYFPNSFDEKISKERFANKEELALFIEAVNNLKTIISHLYQLVPENDSLDPTLYEILRLCESKFVSSDFPKILTFVDETEGKVLLYALSRESVTEEGIGFASLKIGKTKEQTLKILKSALTKIATNITNINLDLSDIEREYLYSTIKRG